MAARDEGKARDALYKKGRVLYKTEAVYSVEKIFCHEIGISGNGLEGRYRLTPFRSPQIRAGRVHPRLWLSLPMLKARNPRLLLKNPGICRSFPESAAIPTKKAVTERTELPEHYLPEKSCGFLHQKSAQVDAARLCMVIELVNTLSPPIILAAGGIIAAWISKKPKKRKRRRRSLRKRGKKRQPRVKKSRARLPRF